uniref:ATP synthase subunit d, mitochondrial n=2 Tax=Graphocephala atropunctata TaxID=36148 RepID=Q1W298_9HEMI|nr:putative mitochondrial ATP synthase [Graphocephala atropunctata]
MAAKRIAQSSINWSAIAERVPAEQRPHFFAFKAKSDAYLRKVVALPEQPPKIDWALYKSKVPNPAMVDDFQKKYDAFKIPVPDDNVSSVIAAEEKEAAAKVQKFKQESAARIVEHEEMLKKLAAQIPLKDMTMEDFAYAFPDECLDPINRPTYWPHEPEDQPGMEDKKDAHH